MNSEMEQAPDNSKDSQDNLAPFEMILQWGMRRLEDYRDEISKDWGGEGVAFEDAFRIYRELLKKHPEEVIRSRSWKKEILAPLKKGDTAKEPATESDFVLRHRERILVVAGAMHFKSSEELAGESFYQSLTARLKFDEKRPNDVELALVLNEVALKMIGEDGAWQKLVDRLASNRRLFPKDHDAEDALQEFCFSLAMYPFSVKTAKSGDGEIEEEAAGEQNASEDLKYDLTKMSRTSTLSAERVLVLEGDAFWNNVVKCVVNKRLDFLDLKKNKMMTTIEDTDTIPVEGESSKLNQPGVTSLRAEEKKLFQQSPDEFMEFISSKYGRRDLERSILKITKAIFSGSLLNLYVFFLSARGIPQQDIAKNLGRSNSWVTQKIKEIRDQWMGLDAVDVIHALEPVPPHLQRTDTLPELHKIRENSKELNDFRRYIVLEQWQSLSSGVPYIGWIEEGEARYERVEDGLSVGRKGGGCNVEVSEDTTLSLLHFRFLLGMANVEEKKGRGKARMRPAWYVVNLQSKNGIRVNENLVTEDLVLMRHHDVITAGQTYFIFFERVG